MTKLRFIGVEPDLKPVGFSALEAGSVVIGRTREGERFLAIVVRIVDESTAPDDAIGHPGLLFLQGGHYLGFTYAEGVNARFLQYQHSWKLRAKTESVTEIGRTPEAGSIALVHESRYLTLPVIQLVQGGTLSLETFVIRQQRSSFAGTPALAAWDLVLQIGDEDVVIHSHPPESQDMPGG